MLSVVISAVLLFSGETRVVPEDYVLLKGRLISGTAASLREDDHDALLVELFFIALEPHIYFSQNATSPFERLGSVRLQVKCRPGNGGGGSLYLYDSGIGDVVQFRLRNYPDWTVVDYTPTGDPNAYIDQAGKLQMRVGYNRKTPQQRLFWRFEVEHANWYVTPG